MGVMEPGAECSNSGEVIPDVVVPTVSLECNPELGNKALTAGARASRGGRGLASPPEVDQNLGSACVYASNILSGFPER